MGVFKDAWARYRLAKRRQRELTEAFARVGINYVSLDTKFYERLLREAIDADAATVVNKYTPLLQSFGKIAEKRSMVNRKHFGDAAKSEFANILAATLEVQKLASGDVSIEDEQGCPKRKALGYVYGYIDAALRMIGQDMADLSVGVPITFHVVRKLWPNKANEYMDFIIRNIGSDKLMMLGVLHGGQQYLDYRKPGRSGVPMGLARFIVIGDEESL